VVCVTEGRGGGSASGEYAASRIFGRGAALSDLSGAVGLDGPRKPSVRPLFHRHVPAVVALLLFLSAMAFPSTALAVADDNGLDSQSPYPTIDPGQSVHIFINIKNTGTNTWRANGVSGYGYQATDGWAARFGSGALWRDVSPGTTITFEDTVTPPAQPGVYRYGVLITRNGIAFGQYFFIDVTVRQPAPSWSVSLQASGTSPQSNASVRLTARASQDVGPTPYYIVIMTGSNAFKTCGSGTECFVDVAYGSGTIVFTAIVGSSDGTTVVARSNQVSVTWSAPPTVDAVALDAQSVYPTIEPGQNAYIYVRIRNSGTTTWRGGGGDGYGYRGLWGWSSFGNGQLWRDVAPNTTITFEQTVQPPSQPGTYRYGFELTRYGQTVGPTFFIEVTVRQPPQSWQIGMSINPPSPTAGQTVTIRATSSYDVAPTPYFIVVLKDGVPLVRCGGGTTCSATATATQAESHAFTSVVGDWDGVSNVLARAGPSQVSWAAPPQSWTVALQASTLQLTAGESVRLTATANRDVSPTPYWIVIQRDGQPLVSCGGGATCTTTTTAASPESHSFTAVIGNQSGTADIVARTNGASVTWVPSTTGAFQFTDLPVPSSALTRVAWYGNTDFAYANRSVYYSSLQGLHDGVDFIVPYGTEITSVVNRRGKVIAVKNAPYAWAKPCNCPAEINVAVDYDTFIVLYGHTSPNGLPSLGAWIEPGQRVAYSGTDGHLEHLHLEVILKDDSWPRLPPEKQAITKPGNERTNPVPMFTPAAIEVMRQKAALNGSGGTFRPTPTGLWMDELHQPNIKPGGAWLWP
jgi:murein DD-endopeptidase MepM/ murein hydrolase activator NlpD